MTLEYLKNVVFLAALNQENFQYTTKNVNVLQKKFP